MSRALNYHLKADSDARVAVLKKEGGWPAPHRCEACNTMEGRLVWHHHDYAHPTDVIPLCCPCHGKVHAGTLPEPRTGRVYPRQKSKHNPPTGRIDETLMQTCYAACRGESQAYRFPMEACAAARAWMHRHDVAPEVGADSDAAWERVKAAMLAASLPTHQIGPAAVLRVLQGATP